MFASNIICKPVSRLIKTNVGITQNVDEIHYVPTNPQLNPECDSVRDGGGEEKRGGIEVIEAGLVRNFVCVYVSPLLSAPQLRRATACERTGSRGDCEGVSLCLCVKMSGISSN